MLRLRVEMLEEEHALDFYWHKTWKCFHASGPRCVNRPLATPLDSWRHSDLGQSCLTWSCPRSCLTLLALYWSVVIPFIASYKINWVLGKNFIFYNISSTGYANLPVYLTTQRLVFCFFYDFVPGRLVNRLFWVLNWLSGTNQFFKSTIFVVFVVFSI